MRTTIALLVTAATLAASPASGLDKPLLAANETVLVSITTETSIGDWMVGSVAYDKKAPHKCTLESATLSPAGRGFDVIKFHFFPTMAVGKARVSVSLDSPGPVVEEPDTSFQIDAGGNSQTISGRNDITKRAFFGLTIDEANQVLKSISEIGANRRLSIIGLGTFFHPSLFQFDKALELLKACVEKLR
jgi:hypothetical protein